MMRRRFLSLVIVMVAICGFFIAHSYAQVSPSFSSTVAWSPNGRVIAVSTRDGIMLYGPGLRKIGRLGEARRVVNHLAWSPDSKKLVTANADYRIAIWDVMTGKQIASLEGHTREVIFVAWSPNGRMIASSGDDYTVRIWDAYTFKPLTTLQPDKKLDDIDKDPGPIQALAWSPNGDRLAGGNRWTMFIWDTAQFNLLNKFEHRSLGGGLGGVLYWTPDGNHLMSVAAQLWDATTGENKDRLISCDASTLLTVLSPDGHKIASSGFSAVSANVCIFKLDSQYYMEHEIPLRFTPNAAPPSSIAWSPDSSRVVTALGNGHLDLWDAATGRLLATAPRPDATSQILVGLVEECVEDKTLVSSLQALVHNNKLNDFMANIQYYQHKMSQGCFDTLLITVEYYQRNPNPTPYHTPAVRRVSLESVCSPSPEQYRIWHILNPNPYELSFTWAWVDRQPLYIDDANGVIPAASGGQPGERRFTTPTQAGLNTLSIQYADGLEEIASSVATPCTPATPTASPK